MDRLNQFIVLIGQAVPKSDINIPKVEFSGNKFVAAMNIFLGIMGAISVLMIAIGGFKYTMSMGEPTSIKKAKDTILYAVIGLLIAILAGTIVNFVLGRV